jgi:NitT/TauT family transport system permease protein
MQIYTKFVLWYNPQKSRRKKMVQGKLIRAKKIFSSIVIILFWFAVWQAASMIINKPLYMPSPYETFLSLASIITTALFWISVVYTIYRVLFGLVISFVLGVILAFIASRFDFFQRLLRPFITIVKSTPVASVIVLALVWFSSSDVPIFACVLMCFPIFYTNVLAGIKSVDKELLEMASVFNIKNGRIITGIKIPSVLPYLYSALSVCLGFSWKSVVAAEVLSNYKYSIGYNLYTTKMYLNTAELFAWTITVIIISVLIEKILKHFLPGGHSI